jgi:hypothetical protein
MPHIIKASNQERTFRQAILKKRKKSEAETKEINGWQEAPI